MQRAGRETEASFCLQTACEGLILLRDGGRLQHTELPKGTAWSQEKEAGQHLNARDVLGDRETALLRVTP